MATRGKQPQPGPEASAAQSRLPPGLPPEMFTGPGMLALADLLPVMVAYFDGDQRMRFLNKALAEYLGRPRSELLGMTLRQILGDEGYERRGPMIEAALAGERQFFVADYDHPAKGPAAVQTEYVPWTAPDGRVLGIVAVVQDVTEQRTAERALRESEARFKRIANAAPAMMWVTRLDRVRDFVNDFYAEFVCGPGCDPEDARTIDWKSRIHPDDVERVIGESLAGEASGQPFTLEARYKRHDSEFRWLRSVSSPRFGPDREPIGFIGVATEITVAKEAELQLKSLVEDRTAALAESEARFRAIFDTVLEVLVLLDPDGTIIEMNRKQAPWRAANAHEGLGRKLWEAPTMQLYPQHAPLLRQGVKTAAKGELFNAQMTMERAGVATAYLDVALQPVRDASGRVVYILFEVRDITELKAAQEQLRQSQKMEALGQLTGGIAHDFNNLLTVVVGGLDLVAKRVEDPKLKRYATNALTAAERGARLTGQLLAFSRVQRLEVRSVHIAPLIQEMGPLLRNVLGPGIQKEFELGEELVAVMADPTQLEVAVLNLAINARDAMPDGGVLRFRTRLVSEPSGPELADGDYVELTISDTGEGMSEDVASRAFEPFFTTKEVGKGTGLGLSMVYGMARQSGGTARIESRRGEGTSVMLYFKAAQTDPVSATDEQVADERELEQRAASVLIVDDDPDVRAFIAEALADQQYRVREAADGKSGLEAFADERPDLVVLDFVMPEISGADVANKILVDHPAQKILFVSGYSETDAIKRIAPNAPLLNKPFHADALCRAVQRALSDG